jgi:hypothetical protein
MFAGVEKMAWEGHTAAANSNRMFFKIAIATLRRNSP